MARGPEAGKHVGRSCTVCGARALALLRARADIEADLRTALARVPRLMHASPVAVHRCRRCGCLFRDPTEVPRNLADRYRDDRYSEAELVRLHRLGRRTYDHDRDWLWAHDVRPGRRLFELGTYAGALLAYADDVGCTTFGIDVGTDTSEFARSLGLRVVTGELEHSMLPRASFDAVFVHNCFEQLSDPVGALAEIRRLLARDGTLVIRTPNADFVQHAHELARRSAASASGVLGVPFVRCFAPGALGTVLRRARFTPVAARGRGRPWMEIAARAV